MGRPKGITPKGDENFNLILEYMLFGKAEITNEKNINFGIKPYVPLKLGEACREIGITTQAFYNYLEHPGFKDRYDRVKEQRRSRIREGAESNILDLVERRLDVEDKDLAKMSLDILTKIDKNYNPKIDMDVNMNAAMLDMSEDEILAKINELNSVMIEENEDNGDN